MEAVGVGVSPSPCKIIHRPERSCRQKQPERPYKTELMLSQAHVLVELQRHSEPPRSHLVDGASAVFFFLKKVINAINKYEKEDFKKIMI